MTEFDLMIFFIVVDFELEFQGHVDLIFWSLYENILAKILTSVWDPLGPRNSIYGTLSRFLALQTIESDFGIFYKVV